MPFYGNVQRFDSLDVCPCLKIKRFKKQITGEVFTPLSFPSRKTYPAVLMHEQPTKLAVTDGKIKNNEGRFGTA
jgi:hypothetical protein